ncbi:hypothetical protein GCM10023080_055470 [Streptomyces pseudoechinosporeus]
MWTSHRRTASHVTFGSRSGPRDTATRPRTGSYRKAAPAARLRFGLADPLTVRLPCRPRLLPPVTPITTVSANK